MILRILGLLFMLIGLFAVSKPERLRKRFQKKTYRKLRRRIFLIALFFALLLIGAALRQGMALGSILTVLGLAVLLKGYYFLKAKSAETTMKFFGDLELKWYRLIALAYIGVGVLFLNMERICGLFSALNGNN